MICKSYCVWSHQDRDRIGTGPGHGQVIRWWGSTSINSLCVLNLIEMKNFGYLLRIPKTGTVWKNTEQWTKNNWTKERCCAPMYCIVLANVAWEWESCETKNKRDSNTFRQEGVGRIKRCSSYLYIHTGCFKLYSVITRSRDRRRWCATRESMGEDRVLMGWLPLTDAS
jgi:hypothetical protein